MANYTALGVALILAGFLIKTHRQSSASEVRLPDDLQEAEDRLAQHLEEIVSTAPESEREKFREEFKGLKNLFRRYLTESGKPIEWEKIQKLSSDMIIDYNAQTSLNDNSVRKLLNKLVVVKLNGGLGTSMGCKGPKSAIPVRGDLTFLDLTVHQIEYLNQKYRTDVPLVLMNSFNTDEDTEKIIWKYNNLKIKTFQQSRYPRVVKDHLTLLATNVNIKENIEAWYPPGHGDFFQSFKNSGLLDEFITQGKEYVFLSNIDNLGATVDVNILNDLMNRGNKLSDRPEFLMELTEKTKADVKGGTLVQYEDKLRLLEIAQVPGNHVADFKSFKNFKFFNTNNLWINLKAIKRVVEDGSLSMELIVNPKTVHGIPVLQLETAVGAAITSFNKPMAINVPRKRFLPVKKTSDLLMVMSNLYTLAHGSLVMDPERSFPSTPVIKLGDTHFSKVKDFLERFPTIPDILDLDHVTISGDVTFGKGVVLKGTVIINASFGERIDIPSGAILEDKIISGNIRILNY